MLFKMILILILSFSCWCINPVEVNHIALGIDKVEEKWELHFKVQLYKIKKKQFFFWIMYWVGNILASENNSAIASITLPFLFKI